MWRFLIYVGIRTGSESIGNRKIAGWVRQQVGFASKSVAKPLRLPRSRGAFVRRARKSFWVRHKFKTVMNVAVFNFKVHPSQRSGAAISMFQVSHFAKPTHEILQFRGARWLRGTGATSLKLRGAGTTAPLVPPPLRSAGKAR